MDGAHIRIPESKYPAGKKLQTKSLENRRNFITVSSGPARKLWRVYFFFTSNGMTKLGRRLRDILVELRS